MLIKSVKCAYCAELNKKCINFSWESLDRVQTDMSSQLEAALDELERVQAQAAATQAKVF